MSGDVQEVAALAIVALVVGIGLWRLRQRRRSTAAGCDGCAASTPPPEATLHFHPRRPGDAPRSDGPPPRH